jgi:thiol-disulfide isomerase/thioredoxin
MKSLNRFVFLLSLVTTAFVWGQTTKPAARNLQDIQADLQANVHKMHEILPSLEAVLDPKVRSEIGPKLIPVLTQLSADFDELGVLQPEEKERFVPAQQQYMMFKSLFGDKEATRNLHQLAESKNPAEAVVAQGSQLIVRWIIAGNDQAAQTKITDELEALAKAHPESEELTRNVMLMSELGPSSRALADRMQDLIVNVLKNPEADAVKEQITSARKLRDLENKPLVISGKLLDGKNFTTANWKGKVILVDFWATWCGPCVAELPWVKKMYADFHGKGLEIVGVSNDYAAADVTQFQEKNPDMPWPQLLDPAAAAQQSWNPITLGFGINAIPTMFLIDKKGIVRSVSAREDFEEMIPKLLAE